MTLPLMPPDLVEHINNVKTQKFTLRNAHATLCQPPSAFSMAYLLLALRIVTKSSTYSKRTPKVIFKQMSCLFFVKSKFNYFKNIYPFWLTSKKSMTSGDSLMKWLNDSFQTKISSHMGKVDLSNMYIVWRLIGFTEPSHWFNRT